MLFIYIQLYYVLSVLKILILVLKYVKKKTKTIFIRNHKPNIHRQHSRNLGLDLF